MDRLARRVRQTLLSGEGRERMRHGARKGLAFSPWASTADASASSSFRKR